ncbi:DUF3019 domain-containing protein [Alteromonadaceae bacterium M269]|nr:DUF3019 domain-containing protein [Alteromonadaceae bacterium M269]
MGYQLLATKKSVCLLASFAYATLAFGQTDQQEQAIDLGIRLKTKVPILVSSPYLCPILPGQELCNKPISLAWETPRRGDYCLWDITNQSEIKCWEQQWSGITELPFQSSHSITYQLRDAANTRQLAEVKVIVLEKLNQKSKRKRHLWRVF